MCTISVTVATLNVEISFRQGRTDRIRKHNYLKHCLGVGFVGGFAGRFFCEFFVIILWWRKVSYRFFLWILKKTGNVLLKGFSGCLLHGVAMIHKIHCNIKQRLLAG